MEELKDYIMAGAIGLIGFFGKWWFNKTDKKIESMDQRISANDTAIKINTQSDKDYREMTSNALAEIKQTQKQIYEILIKAK